MHFTRLRLLGFKSFVDPTELIINQGLTGVVGPNGCGKSNLLEALRWVMGENRASAMRGDGMEDVIFNGSGGRPARNHAEVTLTIDNRERTAPAGFNDEDELTVVRRIVREAGSIYRANGKEARARDVAMLFADASTGAHSPALVRQGQISELINARPKARRRILEEAAGISGLYQRRHEAELKLKATEVNLSRVGDVLEALEAQLGTLARQARAAQRYREIAEGLRRAEAMLLWRHWHDADTARAAATAALTTTARAAGIAQTDAAVSARAREEAEAAMPGLREEDAIAGAVLQRLALERDRIDGEAAEAVRAVAALEAQIVQLAADREREAALDRDAVETTGRLAEEAADLEAAGEGHEDALEAARDAAAEAGAALDEVQAEADARAEEVARLLAEHQAARRLRDDAGRRTGEIGRGLEAAEGALDAARRDLETAEETRAEAGERAEIAAEQAAAAEEALASAEQAAAAARDAGSALTGRLAAAEGTAKALQAEAAGIERLLGRAKSDVAPILDAVEVAPGFEAALGAALGDDLAHPAATADSGWHALPPLDVTTLPGGAEPLAARVQAPDALARRLGAIGVVDRADGARLQPMLRSGQRLVSREGDLWRWDGLTLMAGAAPSATAERLTQRNRLAALRAEIETAEAELDALREARDAAASRLAAATAAESTARAARRTADQAASEAARAFARAETALEALQGRTGSLRSAAARRREELEAAEKAEAQAEDALAALADPAEAKAAVDAGRMRVEAARITMLTRRTQAEEIARSGEARSRRLAEIAREIGSWAARKASASGRLSDLDRRAEAARTALDEAQTRPPALEARRDELRASHEEAESRRRRAADALAVAETALRTAEQTARASEKAAGDAREARARAEAVAEGAEARAAETTERLETETGRSPADVLESLAVAGDQIPAASALDAEVDRLRRARDGMGAVNLRAEEDARELKEEADTLARERADLEEAIAKLRQGIANLNREGRGRLLAAFDEVNASFGTLFQSLFGGGEANLVLVESDDPLEAGLEIMCQPPGKKLSTLSLLSGGEQTLTALSLIFAVFLANPAPICVLDEVDAPLDDANVTRFCDLLDEMTGRTDTRFLIITHHAVTMSRMDRLFGVTMAEKGVSQLVSVDLAAAERMVESA